MRGNEFKKVNQDFETPVNMSSQVFLTDRETLTAKVKHTPLTVTINFLEDEKHVNVIISHKGKKDLKYIVSKGDTLNISHDFEIDITKEIKKDHPFPVEYTFNNQTYFLRKTKQNKLILTK